MDPTAKRLSRLQCRINAWLEAASTSPDKSNAHELFRLLNHDAGGDRELMIAMLQQIPRGMKEPFLWNVISGKKWENEGHLTFALELLRRNVVRIQLPQDSP